MYELVTGAILIIIALPVFIGSIFNLSRQHDQTNSPLVWIGLIAGIFLGSFGILLVLFALASTRFVVRPLRWTLSRAILRNLELSCLETAA